MQFMAVFSALLPRLYRKNSIYSKTKFGLLFVFLLTQNSQSGFSQTDSIKIDSASNFESYSHKLGVYLYGIQKYNNFELKNKAEKVKVAYSPNENLNLGLGFTYKWLGVGAAFNFAFINSDNEIYGKTQNVDLQLDIYTKRFLMNGNFQFYKNYYWKNIEDFYPGWNIKDSAVVRPDISTATLGFNTIYIFNHKTFSFKPAFQNTQRQLRSAGSWLAAGRFSIYGIGADSSIVPDKLQASFPLITGVGSLGTLNLGGAFGYTHTFVLAKYFYFNAAAMIGVNLQTVSMADLEKSNIYQKGKLSSNGFIRLALGCNKPTHYYGFSAWSDSFLITNPSKTEFSYNYGKFKFFYGRRFNI